MYAIINVMLDIYATLEINKVLSEVASYTRSELAKERILNLRMTGDKVELKRNLALLKEMMSCSLRHNNPPIEVSFDLSKYLEIAKKSGVLSPLELDHVALDIETANKIHEYFLKVEKEQYPLLLELSRKLYNESHIAKQIRSCIAPNLSIRDDASEKLTSIRRSIISTERKVRDQSATLINRYKEFLSDSTVTIRNDHFVLPVKSSNKSQIPGIIHDVSDSGLTTFIEPAQLVQLSNELYVLRSQEREEINRILKELTNVVASSERELLQNNKVIAEIDYLTAKSNYGNERNGFAANLVDDRVLIVKNARHPLIEDEKAVRNSFNLDKDQRIIIISGPNAGGKTVALKTLGLVVMMNQMAIPVLTSETPTLPFFPRIYADIGDNQSLADNLSTFAAHISNLSTITYFVTAKDLVLIDELGTGTSPNEGEAIAISVTKFLLDKGTYALVSSHFEAMKEFAYSNKGAVNAMMVFDDKKLLPTYSLRIGLPGRSYGLEMAKRYHLDDSVLNHAKEYLDKHETSDINDILDELTKTLNANEEIDALHHINTKTTAVVDEKFKATIGEASVDTTATITLVAYEPNKLTYETNAAKDGVVVLSEIYYPGWEATIDDTETDIACANYVLRAIKVPAGKNCVVLTFRPKSIETTEAIAYGAMTILIIGIAIELFTVTRKKKKIV